MEKKARKPHVRWTAEELEKLVKAAFRIMLNDNNQDWKYLNKAQMHLPKERRRNILAKSQMPPEILASFRHKRTEVVAKVKDVLDGLEKETLLIDASPQRLAAELDRKLNHPDESPEAKPVAPTPIAEVVRPQAKSSEPASPVQKFKHQAHEDEPSKKKFRILVLGVWPRHEKKFADLMSKDIKLEFRAPREKIQQVPQVCDLCIALTGLPKKWAEVATSYKNCKFVGSINGAVALIHEHLPK